MAHSTVDTAAIVPEMAAQIRTWRVDEDFSWRAVAQAASDVWGCGYGSNQLYGRDLCVGAAKALGEDPYQEPWSRRSPSSSLPNPASAHLHAAAGKFGPGRLDAGDDEVQALGGPPTRPASSS
jgi:hypothetical protein